MKNKIELVNALPTLIAPYKNTVRRMINENKITLKEWNSKYKNYRDDVGYSIIHLFEAHFHEIEVFITINPIMLEDKDDLFKRFNVKVMTPKEMMEDEDGDK